MKKDIDKLLSQSIQTYYFLLVIVVIIKLLGGNYFEMNLNNKSLVILSDIIHTFRLENLWYTITLYINIYIVASLSSNDNSKKLKIFMLCMFPIAIFIQYLKSTGNTIVLIIDFIYLGLLPFIYCKIYHKKFSFSNYIAICILVNLFQIISMLIRNRNVEILLNNFIINFVYNLDFLIMLILLYKIYFKERRNSLCQMVVYSGSQKLISLKHSLKEWHAKCLNKPNYTKEEKVTMLIYYPLYLLWNLFTMLVIILIATLNDALSEAIFITIAFWIDKRVFGKPFHFKSVGLCFCFSSIVYYVLTRITFHIETSLFIPIFLGVSLSFVTSHFIKENYKLYKGMEEQELYDTIKKVTSDPLVIKICKEYYCDRYNDVKIASINNYSVPSIRNKRQMVNRKLKSL